MNYKWIVDGHHIALENKDEILHPNANEIFAFVSGDDESLSIPDPIETLKELRFSKIGSPIKCEILTTEKYPYYLSLYAIRKNKKWPVDIIEGQIIDHCVSNNEWFYINGDIETLQNYFSNANIKTSGPLNIAQYIDLIKQDFFSGNKEIINNVSVETIGEWMNFEGDIPYGVKANLYAYQKIGYLWMRNMALANQGCILGDEMGLGKTIQILTLFLYFKQCGQIPLLVVAPVSLLENWKRECNKFAPSLDILIHHGSGRTGRFVELLKYDVVVISYNTAVSDLAMLKMIEWRCVVLDEAQNIKNPFSERAKSVKAITRKMGIAVTGTPFENHVTDIWSIVDFSVPGLLGTLNSFKNHVTDDVLGAEKIEPILTPILLRRLVKDVANDLPEKIVISQPLAMSVSEKIEYEKYRQEARASVNGLKAPTLGILQKLRMYCTHQFLCETSNRKDPYDVSIKYQRFCEIVEEIVSRDEKVIVFTSYRKMFDIFMEDIPKRFNIKIGVINGETPIPQRQKIVDWFNNYAGSIMLVLNPRAAGTGLNITGANHVIHYNMEWNPSLEDQSSARAYRRGQKKNVFIYRLYYTDTVEQVVNERIENKREIASAAVIGNDGENNNADILRALELAPELY